MQSPRASYSHLHASVTKQYNLLLAKVSDAMQLRRRPWAWWAVLAATAGRITNVCIDTGTRSDPRGLTNHGTMALPLPLLINWLIWISFIYLLHKIHKLPRSYAAHMRVGNEQYRLIQVSKTVNAETLRATTTQTSQWPCYVLCHEDVQRTCQRMYTQHHTTRSIDVCCCEMLLPWSTLHHVLQHSLPSPLSSCGSYPPDAPCRSTITNDA